MTNLQIFANSLKLAVSCLPKNYNEMTVDELANGYCEAVDNNDEFFREAYCAGLVLKFWYLIDKLYKENGNALKMDREDFIYWIEGAILQACTERAWVNNPKLKAQQVIQQIIATRYKAMAYYESNLHIHKANYATESLNTQVDDDNETTGLDLLESNYLTPSEQYNAATEVIQRCLDNNKVIEAIITETFTTNDCSKDNKFWPYKVVKLLSNLPDSYENYFLNTFRVEPEILRTCLEKIKKSNNTKLYQYLSETQTYLRSTI